MNHKFVRLDAIRHDEVRLRELESYIRRELVRIRRQIKEGDESEIVVWVIPDKFACSQRPLRDHARFGGSGRPLPLEARPLVVKWVGRVKEQGIRSIVCLMHLKELRYYDVLGLDQSGLLGFYRSQGLSVCHVPWSDPAHAQTADERASLQRQVGEIKFRAMSAYDELPKPVLLHCSAAVDRTTPVAAFIAYHRGQVHVE